MKITPISTRKVTTKSIEIDELLDESLPPLKEKTIVAVTSKVISLCQGRVAPLSFDKQRLIKNESDYYLPHTVSKFDFTINKNTLIPAGGIDESNSSGNYVLWPEDPQGTANQIRQYLNSKFNVHDLGVIITDSTCIPLRWGTVGISIAFSGFKPNKNYVGKPDLFKRPFEVQRLNITDTLASAAVAVMGEGTEQTPIAIIEDLPFVEYTNRDPTKKELGQFYISDIKEDLFAVFLQKMNWQKGGHKPK